MTKTILIIEDEAAQAELLKYNLEREGFEVLLADTADLGMELLGAHMPSLVILDWMLPDRSGIYICSAIKTDRDTGHIPIIMLTARGTEEDKVRGLNVGADDYVVKPYSIKELIARVHANLRKTHAANAILTYGDLTMNTDTHRVTRDGNMIKLGPLEFKLLKTLLTRPAFVFSRAQLLDRVWGTDIHVDERTVDVHMGRLRKNLNQGMQKNIIRTVRGAGYALDVDT